MTTEILELRKEVQDLEFRQKTHTEVVSEQYLRSALNQIQIDQVAGRLELTYKEILTLRASLRRWNNQLDDLAQGRPAEISDKFIPIVLYHYTPENFEQQLDYLEQHQYIVVDLDQVAAALAGGTALPAKPVVLTFDDGFADQLHAFQLLKKHKMKATFYIINAGEASKWCIGAGRRYHDPIQPAGGCGDSYMNWNQIRELDQSGLITIAGHTIDHSNLPTLPVELQRFEISESKQGIEREIGHPIRHFAYPYGAFNGTTIELVREAGYITATTTQPGYYQSPSAPYALHRIRDTLKLP